MDRDDEREFERLKRDKRKADKKGNLKEVSQICNYMGELLAKYGKWEEAKKEHEMELSLSEALCDTIGSAIACRKIGECFCGMEQYEKGLHYQQRHLSLAKSCNSLIEEQRALATIGRTYLIQSDAAKGNDALMQVSKKAEESFKKSLDVCEKLKREVKPMEYMEMKARLYLNLGLVYDGQGKVTECAEYMKKAISIAQQHKLYSDLYRCQYSLASMYQRAGNLSQALRYLEAAHSSAIKLKDKYLESEALSQKAIINLQLGDYATCKHALKKAHKLGSTTKEEADKIKKCFKAASKMEEASENLETCPVPALDTRMKLFETLGDCAAEAGSYKQAIEYYHKMYECAVELNKPAGELIPIYVSLAQTYADDKQYQEAINSYKKEIELRGNDNLQICRTWLAIAELQEQAGDGYTAISQSYLSAFSYAKKAKQHKLQVYVLKSLTEVQRIHLKNDHLTQTQRKLESIKAKYDIASDDELVDEDSQRIDDKTDEDDDDDDNCSISELSESESEDEVQPNTNTHNVTGRTKRTVQAKRNEKGETPLHRACIEGNLKKVKKLIQQGHPVNPRDYCGWIPLHEAANHGFRDIVEYLLESGGAVNDRGGTHCMGVTPLIDAANCGNLDVMEVLISKGANVLAKDDEGNNALDCLQSWWGRCESLSDEDVSQYQSLVEKLSSRSTGGRTPLEAQEMVFTQNSQSGQSSKGDSDILPVLKAPGQHNSARKTGNAANLQRIHSSQNKITSRTSRSLRRTLSSDSDSDETSNFKNDSDEDSENIYGNPGLSIDILSASATDSYKTAIRSVGQSASRRDHTLKGASSTSARKEKEAGAFVNEEEFVDDDWLIDDMRPSSKRRRVNVNGAFTSGSTCKNKSNVSGEGISSKIIQMHSEDIGVDEMEGGLSDIDSDNYRSLGNFESMPRDDRNNANSTETVVIDDNSPISTRNNRLSLRSKPSKKRQLKLTNFGLHSSVPEDISRQTSSSVMGNRTLTNQNVMSLTQNVSSMSSQSNLTNLMASQSVAIPVTSVKVRVKDKLLVVPVFEIDVYESISWLAKQASQRYYKLVGLRPILSLRTKDGAILTFDDPLSLVLSSNEEIEGSVENWDLPPITERYDQACKALNAVGYRNIRTILGSSESSGVLDLRRLSLRASQFLPVFRAIQCQNALKKLYLQDNRLSDAGMESFLSAIQSLPNLAVLDLSCNLISYVGIKTLANFLRERQGQDGKCVAKNLTDLNLGHNSLGDGCCADLSSIVSCLPSLSMLGLSSCDFTARFLQQHRLIWTEAIQRSSITSLNISHNALGCLGMEHLLNSLVPERLLNLDLSYTMTTTSPTRVFVDHLRAFLTKEKSVLQKLTLHGCYLTIDDTQQIAKGIEEQRRVTSLDLSCNPKLGNDALFYILDTAKGTGLEQLVMENCGVVSPLSSDLIDSIMEKLGDRCPLKCLCFTCVKLDKIDTESLHQVWREHWGDLSVIKMTENSVKLAVCET